MLDCGPAVGVRLVLYSPRLVPAPARTAVRRGAGAGPAALQAATARAAGADAARVLAMAGPGRLRRDRAAPGSDLDWRRRLASELGLCRYAAALRAAYRGRRAGDSLVEVCGYQFLRPAPVRWSLAERHAACRPRRASRASAARVLLVANPARG